MCRELGGEELGGVTARAIATAERAPQLHMHRLALRPWLSGRTCCTSCVYISTLLTWYTM